MKGDYTRLTFEPTNHFSAVRQQQGRVQVDADWNEQVDIQAFLDRTTTRDVIGPSGVPDAAAGLGLEVLGLVQTVRAVSFSRTSSAGGAIVGDTGVFARAFPIVPPPGVKWGTYNHLGAPTLRGASVLDDGTTWAVGDRSTIVRLDPSQAWTVQNPPSGVTAALRAVHFVDNQHGWAVGDRATIINTVTAGGSPGWMVQVPPGDVRVNLRGVHFVDNQHGWAVGDRATIIATSDGGITWARQAAFPTGSPFLVNNLRGVFFHNVNQGFAVGDGGTILATNNGGQTWGTFLSGVATTLRAVSFGDLANGWAVGDGATILASTDAGTTWHQQQAPAGVTGNLRGVSFIDTKNGYAAGDGGAVISTTDGGATWVHESVDDPQLGITAGRMYVDGILCQNEAAIALAAQPDPTGVKLPDLQNFTQGDPTAYLFYLDVWERHLTALERPTIREVALGGPDTTTRTKVVWQVRWRTFDQRQPDRAKCGGPDFVPAGVSRSGSLAARAAPSGAASPCLVPPGGGYRRLENQLYRVEIHQQAADGTWTYKWSRDNGSVAARLERVDADQLSISAPGPDTVAAFDAAPWAEVTDEERTLAGQPGDLVALKGANAGKLVPEDPTKVNPPGSSPIVRRWDGTGTVMSGWVELEDGVQIQFESVEDSHRSGDYWVIPARSLTATVEWPLDEGAPSFRPPAGIQHHYAPLAELTFVHRWEFHDCRPVFGTLQEFVRPDAIHVTEVALRIPSANARSVLDNEDTVEIGNLANGIDITFDRPVNDISISRSCSLTVEVPYPISVSDIQMWGQTFVGFQPIVLPLNASAEPEGSFITCALQPPAIDFLNKVLSQLIQLQGYPKQVLARLLLRGNFIWAASDPSVWLDGETFGFNLPDSGDQVHLRKVDGRLSGDGNRGADFKMSFFVVLAGRGT